MKKSILSLALLTALVASQTNIFSSYVPKMSMSARSATKRPTTFSEMSMTRPTLEKLLKQVPRKGHVILKESKQPIKVLVKKLYEQTYEPKDCWVIEQEGLKFSDLKKGDLVAVATVDGEKYYIISKR